MKKLIDCFTFYNELDMLEFRLTELYDVVDKFVLVEANKTQNGADKGYFFEDNKWRYEKWIDKIIHVKIIFPEHLDTWGREKYQRNSSMPSLYSLNLSPDDIIVISDLDEIPDFSTLSYIKNTFHMKGLYKLEMDHYWCSLYNKMVSPEKWYHAKIVDWDTLRTTRTPDECRLDFNCQWWENGGWHLSYFGGPDVIVNKINNMAHQELNQDRFKIREEIIRKVREGKDLFDEWRIFKKIDPFDNPYFPKNWKILSKHEEKYGTIIKEEKNLVLGAAIDLGINDIKIFIESFRKNNKKDDVYILIEESAPEEKISYLLKNSVNILFYETGKILETQPNNYRFIKFFDFIKENSGYKNVLLADVSDVYFQSDPFEGIKGDFIFFAEEDESETIGSNGFNSRWILQSFGKEALEKIKHNKILCCGTTIGSYDNILLYCKMLTSEMVRIKKENNPHFFDMMDQGIHNYLCYTVLDKFKNPSIKNNGDFFATIGITCTVSPEKIINRNNQIEVNKKIPRIIHQYNRSNQLICDINSLLHSQKNDSKLLETEIEGFSIFTFKNDAVGESISNGNIWEPHIVSFLKRNLNKNSVFIDIGSNYGWHSLIAAGLCNKVYSFEPQSVIYNLQKMSIEKNNFDNIILYNKGLGNTSLSLNLSPINYDLDNLNIGDLSIGTGGEKIDVITLDSLSIDRVDLIKMDVQGYEKYVIEGAEKTIDNNRPIMIIEVEEFQLARFGLSSTDIFDKVTSLGYEIYLMEHTYPSDHICVPLEKMDLFESSNNIVELKENNQISNSYANGITKKLIYK